MIYNNITTIPYPFLKNAVMDISKKYEVQSVRIDPKGEVYVKVSGQLSEDGVKDILEIITPKNFQPVKNNAEYAIDYDYAETGEATYVYSLDWIDYTKLKV